MSDDCSVIFQIEVDRGDRRKREPRRCRRLRGHKGNHRQERARHEIRPTCHPDRPHRSIGLCSRCYAEAYAAVNPEAIARAKAKYDAADALRGRRRKLARYGLTIEDYEAMLAAQGGVCAICHRPESTPDRSGTGRIRRLVVDHDHATGLIRGLLCSTCNTGIGNLGDDVDRLQSAIEYLAAARRMEQTA